MHACERCQTIFYMHYAVFIVVIKREKKRINNGENKLPISCALIDFNGEKYVIHREFSFLRNI